MSKYGISASTLELGFTTGDWELVSIPSPRTRGKYIFYNIETGEDKYLPYNKVTACCKAFNNGQDFFDTPFKAPFVQVLKEDLYKFYFTSSTVATRYLYFDNLEELNKVSDETYMVMYENNHIIAKGSKSSKQLDSKLNGFLSPVLRCVPRNCIMYDYRSSNMVKPLSNLHRKHLNPFIGVRYMAGASKPFRTLDFKYSTATYIDFKTELEALVYLHLMEQRTFGDDIYKPELDLSSNTDTFERVILGEITLEASKVERYKFLADYPYICLRYNLFSELDSRGINLPSFKVDSEGFIVDVFGTHLRDSMSVLSKNNNLVEF